MARFVDSHEVSIAEGDWKLCFQWGEYQYEDGVEPQVGYRFIWRRPDGSIQSRGPARIPAAECLFELLQKASTEGWFIECEHEHARRPAA